MSVEIRKTLEINKKKAKKTKEKEKEMAEDRNIW